MINAKDIPMFSDTFTHNGLNIRLRLEQDDIGPPWENCDGHGPVIWSHRNGYRNGRVSKTPGQQVLYREQHGAYLYDWQEAIKLAKRDRWGSPPGSPAFWTRGQVAEAAVQHDFDYLRRWCNGDWHYVIVDVEVTNNDGKVLGRESCGGVEGADGYWRDIAAELINDICASADIEAMERMHWAERDVITVPV